MTVEERKILEEYLELQDYVLKFEYKTTADVAFRNTVLCRERGLGVLAKIVDEAKDKLAPCPWCKKEAKVSTGTNPEDYVVRCSNVYCKVRPSTNIYDRKQDAIDAWNEGLE